MSQTSQRQFAESDGPIKDELEDAFTGMVHEGTQRLWRSGMPKGAAFTGEDVLSMVHGAAQAVWDSRIRSKR